MRLPLGAGPTDKHVPILVSKDISSKDRVVVFLGERQMEPGVLSWRVIGDAGIKHGSMVDFVDAILHGPTATAGQKAPGVIIANPCQLLWYRGGARAVSDAEWMDMPRESAVSEALRIDGLRNRVEGNGDYEEHVRYVFEKVVKGLVKKDAMIDLIAVEYAASAALEYLAGNCEFNVQGSTTLLTSCLTDAGDLGNEWASRITGICLAIVQYKMEDLVEGGAPDEFVSFISKRCRAYTISPSGLETPVSGREKFGCNCYASGESGHHENVVVKAWRSMLAWLNMLYANPLHEEIEFVYMEAGEDEDKRMVWSIEEAEAAAAAAAASMDGVNANANGLS